LELSERRLWLGYVSRLADRNIEKTKASGATTWVLLGVSAAIVYRAVPNIPVLLQTSGAIHATLAVFTLQVDAVFHAGAALFYAGYYAWAGLTKRIIPRNAKRPLSVLLSCTIFLVGGASALNLLMGVTSRSVSIAQWTMVGFSAYWFLNFCLALRERVRQQRGQKRGGVDFPGFLGGSKVNPNSGSVTVSDAYMES
jgi:hypothetical protein